MNILPKFQLLATSLILLLLTSCSDEEYFEGESDPYVEYRIAVVDEKGNNLVDPANPNNILDRSVSVVYHGEEYPLESFENEIQIKNPYARTYLTTFYGIFNVTKPQHATSGPYLYVGEFDDVRDVDEFTIKWGDGMPDDVIKFKTDTKGSTKDTFKFNVTTWVNGKKHKNVTDLTIVKK